MALVPENVKSIEGAASHGKKIDFIEMIITQVWLMISQQKKQRKNFKNGTTIKRNNYSNVLKCFSKHVNFKW